jgi:hypothetical protein
MHILLRPHAGCRARNGPSPHIGALNFTFKPSACCGRLPAASSGCDEASARASSPNAVAAAAACDRVTGLFSCMLVI